MYYILFVFRFFCKIIGLSFLNLAFGYGPGLGLKCANRAGLGPKILVCGPGLDECLRAMILTANFEPGLGSNYRPVQGTSLHTYFSSSHFLPLSRCPHLGPHGID